MAGKAKRNKRHVDGKGRRDVSGVFLIADSSTSVASSPTDKETIDSRMISEGRELSINALPEEPTDELSVLLAEKIDGASNPNEDMFMPKNLLPDPELIALAESIWSYYEQNEEAWSNNETDDPIFTFSHLNSALSLQPPSTRIHPWIKLASLVAAALVITLVGAGGWYAARKVTHLVAAEAAPSVSQRSRNSVNANKPTPIRQTHEPLVNAETTHPVSISQTTKRAVVVYKTKKNRSKIEREHDNVIGSESVSQTPKPTRSAIAVTTHDDAAEKVIVAAALRHESSELERTTAQTDRSKDGVFEPIAAESATSPQLFKATETGDEDKTANSSSIPEMLTREQVRNGFKSVYQQISQCAAGKHGIAIVNATLTGSGRVVFALVEGDFKGSPEGSCMALTVRKARFPEFTKSKLTVEFPYVL